MAGIFPSAGTQASNTQNGVVSPDLVTGCEALFYRGNCNPRFDPIATNALISEILNAVNKAGIDYDCSKLDNLGRAIAALSSLCALDTATPDSNDLVAGCIDGQNRLMTIASLLGFAPDIFSPAAIAGNDYIGFADTSAGDVARKVTVDALKQYIIGDEEETGNVIAYRTTSNISDHDQGYGGYFDVTGLNELRISVSSSDYVQNNEQQAANVFQLGSLNIGTNTTFMIFRQQSTNTWFRVINYVASAVATGDRINWDVRTVFGQSASRGPYDITGSRADQIILG